MNDNQDRIQEFRDALLAILDEALSVDSAACGKIRVYDPRTGRLEICAQRGLSDAFVKALRAVEPTDAIASARAFRLGHRVAVPDVHKDPHSTAYAAVGDAGFKAVQATPLIGADGRTVGTLSTHFPRVHHPSKAAGLVLDYLAAKAAAAIEAVRDRRPRADGERPQKRRG